VGVQAKSCQVLVAGKPDPEIIAIVAPGRFVGVSQGQGADFFKQVLVERQPASHGLAFEAKGAGGNKFQAEEVGEELADFANRNIELIAQVHGGGFGRRTDIGTGHFPRAASMDNTVAGGAMGLLVDKRGDHNTGFHEDILLEVLMNLPGWSQLGALAQRAGAWKANGDDQVNVGGFAPLPSWMAFGSATLFWGGPGL